MVDRFGRYKAFDGLEKDADAQSEQEASVEEGAEKAGSLPAKRKILAILGFLGYLRRVLELLVESYPMGFLSAFHQR